MQVLIFALILLLIAAYIAFSHWAAGELGAIDELGPVGGTIMISILLVASGFLLTLLGFGLWNFAGYLAGY